jgi:TonB family protein
MTPAIHAVMLAVSSSPAASIVAKATVATALGLVATWLARRSRAAVRHALLAAAFGVLLVLPVASLVAPPVRIAVPAEAGERVGPTFADAAAPISAAAPAHPNVAAPVAPRSAGLSPSALLLGVWMAGTAFFLLPVAMGLWQVRRLRRDALPWRHAQSAFEKLALEAGIHRRVEVLLHGALPGPMTCGVWHPAIVLPEDAQTWEPEDLNRAMVHELEHVRRGDWVSHCLARAVCAVYWFHPLVWIAWRQLALEAERSCDDAVLARSEATAYADQLVGLAQRLSSAARMPAVKSPLLAMANRADLAARVGAVLDSRQRRGRAGTAPVALACAAAVVLVLTMSPLTMVAAPQAGTDVSAPVARFSAHTGLVIEDAIVIDQTGKSIEGLSAKDFVVTEDGVPQTIEIVEFQKLAGTPQETKYPFSSYYILGYYTHNENVDGKFRRIKIKVPGKEDTIAKLDYRMGYYTRPGDIGFGGRGGVNPSIGLNMTPPILLSKFEPAYSEEARKAKYQGTVVLNVEVGASGQVTNMRVARSLGLGLDEKAMDAVRRWKFKPGMTDARPVAMQVQVEVNFRLL